MGRPAKEAPNHGIYYEVKKIITDSSGNKKRKSFYSTISKADAARQANEYQIKVLGKPTENKTVKFKDYAIDWLENSKRGTVSASTYEYTYKLVVHNHLIPYFKSYNLSTIKREDVEKFFNLKRSFSYSQLDKLKITLSAIFERAIEDDIIYKNPCKKIVLPRSEQTPKEKHAYTPEEARRLIDYAKSVENGESIAILLKTGLRRGELLGLRWKDIDLKNKVIHVRNAVKEVRGAAEEGLPKSKNSVRDIPFDDELKSILTKIPKRITKTKGKKDNPIKYDVENLYVIPDSRGLYMRPTNWAKRVYNPVISDFMLEEGKHKHDTLKLSAHELRHTYGTLLYKSGTDIYTIQKLMGHSDISVTISIYVHNDLDTIKKAMKLDY
ncbi:MAG: site-specific integrase [Clostridium sp.]|uniref:tyrosine-type recombinase/integrase n=1 Tax=Clostridium sp. TaxID=1506 RepID=UPI00290BD871|nr:site-specific integrase [Clostridium sp.]MDU7338078.1 site-specific integrase [Clostridium sp.]